MRAWRGVVALSAAWLAFVPIGSSAQGVDCGQIRAQIAQLDRGGGGGNRYAAAARKQAAELARTQAYAQQLNCSGGIVSFFGGGDPRCAGINQRISQMQANLGQLQAAGGAGMRNELVQRYNAYCRGTQPPQQRGFFESLFGGSEEPKPGPLPELPQEPTDAGGGSGAHGGGQAVCVRTCDGGFFPMSLSSRHNPADLKEMCSALCPGTETAVYTRSPDADIKTAMGLDGKPYVDMPNALKFEKAVTPDCTCRPAGKTWAEALANAEEVLGSERKGDIMVTPEKSDELSRPNLDAATRQKLLQQPATDKVTPQVADKLAADPTARSSTQEVTGPDGEKRLIRRVGPQN